MNHDSGHVRAIRPADAGLGPRRALHGGDAALVQVHGDRVRLFPLGEAPEYLAHDLGLFRVGFHPVPRCSRRGVFPL